MKLKDIIMKNICIICFGVFNISCMAQNIVEKEYERIVSKIKEAEKNKNQLELLQKLADKLKEKMSK